MCQNTSNEYFINLSLQQNFGAKCLISMQSDSKSYLDQLKAFGRISFPTFYSSFLKKLQMSGADPKTIYYINQSSPCLQHTDSIVIQYNTT